MGRISCIIPRLRAMLAVFIVSCLLAPAGHAEEGERIDDIRIEGSKRIAASTVRSYMDLKSGDAITPGRIDRALKSLFATGLFADVTIRKEGPVLIVRILENPIINRIVFEGNRRIDDDILLDEVKLRPRVVFTRSRVRSDAERIMEIYRRSGRFSASVVPKVIQLPQNRVDLVFEIQEGELTRIRKISFVGNKQFDDGDLREVVQTKESAWYRFLTSDDNYDPDRLTFDRELLRRHYLASGYADFRVVSAIAELTPDKKAFFVTFTVDEGQRYKFGKPEVRTELKNLDLDQFRERLPIKTGDWYNADEVEEAIGILTDEVGELGYAFVDIRPRVRRDRESRTIDVTFSIQEGPRVFVDQVEISGNVRTLDEVIRREVLLLEGDAFNTSKLRRSRQRIRNLGFFERVNVENKPGISPDRTVVDISVSERSTGEVSLGAGFSSTNGPIADIGLKERNLLGRGQYFNLGLQVGAKVDQIDLSFTEPYFLDREVSAGFDLFRTARDLQEESSFDKESIGFGLHTRYSVSEKISQSWKYTLREDDVSDVPSDASAAIKEQEGDFVTSSIGHRLFFDNRDSRRSPTDGYFVELENTLAGFGGDSQYLRNQVRSTKFIEITDGWIMNLGGAGGHILGIGDDIRIIDRFFLGGTFLRGFEQSGVGPRDLITNDAVGGNWFYRGSVGLTFPLGLPNEFGIEGRVFSDAGSLGENDSSIASITDTGSLRMSVGAGLLWSSPLGPMNLDFARAIIKESFDQTEVVRFSVGTKF